VIVRLVAEGGSRSERRRSASPIVESDATGIESVEGKPRPGKVVRRIFIVCGAMFARRGQVDCVVEGLCLYFARKSQSPSRSRRSRSRLHVAKPHAPPQTT
jgi:hypothetical protein